MTRSGVIHDALARRAACNNLKPRPFERSPLTRSRRVDDAPRAPGLAPGRLLRGGNALLQRIFSPRVRNKIGPPAEYDLGGGAWPCPARDRRRSRSRACTGRGGRATRRCIGWCASTWRPYLERAREGADGSGPVADHVEQTFRDYLKCGLLAHGFARARCPSCGLDLLVAFSCKRRGVCPSCEGRHRVETAAHLVDHVIPRVPVRHWVLSLPRRVRYFCQRRPAVASAVLRIFLRAVETRVRQRSPGGAAGSAIRCGGLRAPGRVLSQRELPPWVPAG